MDDGHRRISSHVQTDRQRDRQTDRDRQTGRETDRQTLTDRQTAETIVNIKHSLDGKRTTTCRISPCTDH